jgi:hypothetical protein
LFRAQVESAHVELSAVRDKHEKALSNKEAEVHKLEMESRQLERQLMILTNSDMNKVDASENRLLKLSAGIKRAASNVQDPSGMLEVATRLNVRASSAHFRD